MADKSNSVRVLQQHLRRAGECITAGDLDAATGHVEAALAVDDSSVAALALQDRITRIRSMQPESGMGVQSPDPSVGGNPASVTPGRFVPKGVNPQSWMSFEGRVAERRFQSLLRAAQEAMERGDVVAARLAVEEARELRPEDPTVEALSEALVALPPAELLLESRSFIQSRTFRAAGILVFGVTVMLALDWIRADPPPSSSAAAAGGSLSREPDVLAAVSRGRADAPVLDRLPAPNPDPRVTALPAQPPAPAAVPDRAATSAETVRPLESAARGGVSSPSSEPPPARVSQPRPGETPDDFVLPSRVTVDAVVTSRAAEARRGAPTGEIPDNYVAPAPVAPVTNRSTVLAPVPAPTVMVDASATSREGAAGGSSGGLPLANVVREASPTPSLGGRAAAAGTPRDTSAAPAAAAAGAAIPLDDRSRVLTAVDSYARAFERLDARAARAVFPTVDESALNRSFNQLESQSLTFSAPCTVDVQGARARASCRGEARYVRKVGPREPRTEPRIWDIRLSRSGDEWFIDSVQVASK